MKNVCFIGAFEKLDLILYVAKILQYLNKKILIVDATVMQKSRYIVPTINPTKSYITRFEDIDIAIGFESYEEIERYIGITEEQKMKYDYILVNTDKQEIFNNFNNTETIKNYFVTSFELYSIRKGIETIKKIDKPIKIKKIIYATQMDETDDYYLEYIALGHKIIWEDEKIIFPYTTEDMEAMIENQKLFKIKIRGLSQLYKESLEYLVTDIIPDVNVNNLRRIMKNIERE